MHTSDVDLCVSRNWLTFETAVLRETIYWINVFLAKSEASKSHLTTKLHYKENRLLFCNLNKNILVGLFGYTPCTWTCKNK
jgi:hypothetical protein